MKKIYTIILPLVLFIISFAFYWYEYRPTKIRKYCNTEVQSTRIGSFNEFRAVQSNYDDNYKKCLRDNGLEK